MPKRFVKAANTDVTVSRSQAELERVLRRYGATGFGVQTDYAAHLVRVMFRVPDAPGEPGTVPVRLEVSVEAVARALGFYDPPPHTRPTEKGWGIAERVAWRHLVLWVDAALSAASAGVQKISEAFLAHTLVRDGGGRVLRVVEQMDAAAGGDWREMLALPSGESPG